MGLILLVLILAILFGGLGFVAPPAPSTRRGFLMPAGQGGDAEPRPAGRRGEPGAARRLKISHAYPHRGAHPRPRVRPIVTPADWQDFAEMTGGASAALTGLLFVGVSLNAAQIAQHQGLRASAAQTLALFITPLVMAAALLAPDQLDWVLGAELIAVGVITSLVLVGIRRTKQGLSDDEQVLITIFNRRGTNIMLMLLFVASGVVVACGQPDGLYLLLPASLVSLVSGVLNAWYFLLPPPASPGGSRPAGPRVASPPPS